MVGRHERVDRVLIMKHTVVYTYTLVDVNPQLVNVGKFTEALRPKLINAVCTTPLMKDFRDNQIAVSYDYHWEDGSEVTMITVAPEDCARH